MMIERPATLMTCFDGHREVAGQIMNLMVRQPTECRCYDCAM